MRILFLLVWGALLLVLQLVFRFGIFGFEVGLSLSTILVIYAGLNYPFSSGLVSVALLSYLVEALSGAGHVTIMIPSLILFIAIQLVADRIYAEAYTTKSLSVFVFSLISQWLHFLADRPYGHLVAAGVFWADWVVQSFVDACVSFPLLILLDWSMERWSVIFSRRRGHVSGSHIFEAKSKQRKYL